MERIDLQDSVYRTQPAEKLQARQNALNAEEQQFQLAKRGEKDEIRDTVAQNAEEAREKRVEGEGSGNLADKRKKAAKKKEKPGEAPLRKKPSLGQHIIDLEI